MSSVVLRATLLTALGAVTSLALNASPVASAQNPCPGCNAILGAPYLEFPPFLFPGDPDPKVCRIRHNFNATNGSCQWVPPPDEQADPSGSCVPQTPCGWNYSVLCSGTGCLDSAGAPTSFSGTWSFNGVPVAVLIPCGQTVTLPNQPCGSSSIITNFAYAPNTINGPVLSLLSNALFCLGC